MGLIPVALYILDNKSSTGDKKEITDAINKAAEYQLQFRYEEKVYEETGYRIKDLKVFARENIKISNSFYEIGNSHLILGNFSESIEFLSKALQKAPENNKAQYSYNLCIAKYNLIIKQSNYEILGKLNPELIKKYGVQLKGILKDLKSSLNLKPAKNILYLTHVLIGTINYNLGNIETAKLDINDAITVNPNLSDAYFARSSFVIQEGELNQEKKLLILEDLNKTIELDPTSFYKYECRAAILLSLNRVEEHLSDCNKAIELNPDAGVAIMYIGENYFANKNYEEALNAYTKVIKLIDNYDNNIFIKTMTFKERAYYNKGLSNTYLRNRKTAIKDFTMAISLKENNTHALGGRAQNYVLLKEGFLALDDFNSILEIDQNFPQIYRSRGTNYHFNLKQYRKAIADYNIHLHKNPLEWEGFFLKGKALAALGENNKARKAFKNALKLKKSDTSIIKKEIKRLPN